MKKCPKCGTEHEKPGTFCSRKCANGHRLTEESKAKITKSLQNTYSKPELKERSQNFALQYWNEVKEGRRLRGKYVTRSIEEKLAALHLAPADVLRVCAGNISATKAAASLKISPITFKAYAKKLNCYKKFVPAGRAISPQDFITKTQQLFESDEIRKVKEFSIRQRVKKYLILLKGHKCKICGSAEWMGQPIPLICDHIDGDSTNNTLENFRVVCPNCDAQLPTYKGGNVGKGREYQKLYMRRKIDS